MHHERCDGTGYPLGLPGHKIDKFAKIVAIADVYDAMTSARIYRGPLCPFQVIGLFVSEGLQKYDPQLSDLSQQRRYDLSAQQSPSDKRR